MILRILPHSEFLYFIISMHYVIVPLHISTPQSSWITIALYNNNLTSNCQILQRHGPQVDEKDTPEGMDKKQKTARYKRDKMYCVQVLRGNPKMGKTTGEQRSTISKIYTPVTEKVTTLFFVECISYTQLLASTLLQLWHRSLTLQLHSHTITLYTTFFVMFYSFYSLC